jgi:putative transposase
MRQPRILQQHGTAFYHCVSRAVDRRAVFGDVERSHFLDLMRALEAFSGLQVLTYCVMSNHFHLLLRVPDRAELPPLTPASLDALLPLLYSPAQAVAIRREIADAQADPDPARLAALLARFDARRAHLPSFLKELKQRFTCWFNRLHSRSGTLWESRFKSLLVEPSAHALLTVAAYIDLNPVRAGLARDPAELPWSGYAAATAGDPIARAGLSALYQHASGLDHQPSTWKQLAPTYRLLLFGDGQARHADPITGAPPLPGLSSEQLEAETRRKGRLPIKLAMRCRLRHLTDGAILGSASFIEAYFHANRHRFPPSRSSGARRMRGADWGELRTLRDLRANTITPPPS